MEPVFPLALFEGLIGAPLMLQLDNGNGPLEVVPASVLWGVTADEKSLLLVMGGPQSQPPEPNRYRFMFRWVPIRRIVGVSQDTCALVMVKERKVRREDRAPVYTDNLDGWEELNKGVIKVINHQLSQLGVEMKTVFRSEEPAPAPEPVAVEGAEDGLQ